ncbi:MAG: glycosyltransferase family 39 protein [Bacteroidales bacterium]|jgi:4-amino-4-deoxy-L-arabinose transferase-like glycosyltransferase
MNEKLRELIIALRPEISFRLKKWQLWLVFVLFITLISIPVFVNLDKPVVRLWDESRRGINAYEMFHNGNWLVTHYNGEPEMWGTKPPLLIWLQVISMKIVGPGELALRLPSAIAAFLTCLLIFLFSAQYLKNPLFGLIWGLVLVTSNSYIDFHAARTGDFDALMTLFMLLYNLAFFKYIEEKKNKDLYLTIIFITLAAFTKGIAGLLFLPGLFLYAVFTRSSMMILKNRHTYYGMLIFLVVIAGFYLGREAVNPGYLKAIWANEIGGRYLETLEKHDKNFWFYLQRLKWPGLIKWWPFILPGVIAGLMMKEKRYRKLIIFSLMLTISHLLIISASQTKLEWYNIPEYPYFALFIASFIWFIITINIKISEIIGLSFLKILAVIFTVIIFYEPSRLMAKKIFNPSEGTWHLKDHEILYVLRDGLHGRRDLDGYILLHAGPKAHTMFYMNLMKDKGIDIARKEKDRLNPGDKVIAYQPDVKKFIEENYNIVILEEQSYVRIYQIEKKLPILDDFYQTPNE